MSICDTVPRMVDDPDIWRAVNLLVPAEGWRVMGSSGS
jgi:hypothetical protein